MENQHCRLYAVYANPEHVHILVSRTPSIDEETLATVIADGVERFVNSNRLCAGIFQWQQSGSAFSVSKGDVEKVCKYILNQKEHHQKQTCEAEQDVFRKFYQQTLHPKSK